MCIEAALYLAVNRQGTIVYNLPCMPPVIYRVISQLAFGVGSSLNDHRADLRINDFIMYSLTGTMWANTMYDLADPYDTTINVCRWVCACFAVIGSGMMALPFIFKTLGVMGATLGTITVCFLTWLSARMLVR